MTEIQENELSKPKLHTKSFYEKRIANGTITNAQLDDYFSLLDHEALEAKLSARKKKQEAMSQIKAAKKAQKEADAKAAKRNEYAAKLGLTLMDKFGDDVVVESLALADQTLTPYGKQMAANLCVKIESTPAYFGLKNEAADAYIWLRNIAYA